MADFLIELPEDKESKEAQPGIWQLYVDGSSSKNGYGVGIRLVSPTREILDRSFRLGFKASNNEEDYEAIIAGMRLTQGLRIEHIHAFCDSQLVANHYSGEYAAKDARMEAYLKIVKNLTSTFKEFTLTRIPRSENIDTDALANLAEATNEDIEMAEASEVIDDYIPTADNPADADTSAHLFGRERSQADNGRSPQWFLWQSLGRQSTSNQD